MYDRQMVAFGARRSAVIACLLLVTASRADAGECAPQLLTPTIATPENATLPSGGGLLVVERSGRSDMAGAGPVTDWRFVDGKKRVAPVARTLAPGLSVLAPVGSRLETLKKQKIRTFRRSTDAAPPLAAPAIKKVEQIRSRQGYRITTFVRAELAAPAPAEQYLVVFDKDGKTARSFGVAAKDATAVTIYIEAECTVVPDKTLRTDAGEQIKLAWVNATGQMSPLSAAFTVESPAGAGPLP